MADSPTNDAEQSAPARIMRRTGPQIGLMAQYVKDLSFENPNAPASLQTNGGAAADRRDDQCQCAPGRAKKATRSS